MSSQIETIPLEVQTQIFSYLRHAEKVHLMLTCKALRHIVEPLIWTHIELHFPEWHVLEQYEDVYQYEKVLNSQSSRPFLLPSAEEQADLDLSYKSSQWFRDHYEAYTQRTQKLLSFFDSAAVLQGPERLYYDNVARRIRSICLNACIVDNDYPEPYKHHSFWLIFSMFQNLESLELTIGIQYTLEEWTKQLETFEKSEHIPNLHHLQTLRLRGYFPCQFVTWALTHPEQLKSLELSVLDRPISNEYHHKVNPPPPLNAYEDEEADDGEIRWFTEDDDIKSEPEDFLYEEVAPRALSTLQDTDTPERLKNLSTLHLIRPAESDRTGDGEWQPSWDDGPYCSMPSEMRILREWARLIRATRGTLEHLILDQHRFCENNDRDDMNDEEFLERFLPGPSSTRFKEIVLPVFLEPAKWPKLKSIRLYGFDVPEPPRTDRYRPLKSRASLVGPFLKDRFEHLGVDIKSSLGRKMIFEADSGCIWACDHDGFGGPLRDP